MLAALTAVPPLAENHSRVLVPAFFAVARQDVAEDANPDSPHLSTRQRQQRTASYLELLSKFANPKAVFRAAELHALYLSILCKGEQKLQGLALRCLMTYKSPNLLPYEENLRTLLDDPKFRDELARFSLGIDSEIINPQHREEVIPVTIRILYGIITSRRGRSSTAQGLAARKQAMLTSLSGCSSDELSTLIDLMLEPFQTASDSSAPTSAHDVVNVAGRQQLGFLTLLADLLRYLGPQTVSHWPRLIGMTIKLVRDAQKRLTHEQDTSVDAFGSTAEDETEEIAEPEKGAIPLRHIRSLGIKRLVQFVQTTTTFDFSPYLSAIFASIISPRLDKLEIENTQAPSGTLDLIAALAASPETALALVEYDNRTLPKVFACMTAVTVKPAVIGRVFDIVEALLEEGDSATTEIVLSPHIHPLLENVIGLVKNLKQSANPDIMERLLLILSRLSAVVIDGQQAQQLASLLGPMLRQSNKQLPEKGKVNVLNTLQKLYAISPDFADPTNEFFTRHYELIANLFQTMFFPSSRRALVAVLEKFAQSDASLLPSFKAVSDINAYSARRLDEPDFDRRLKTFAQLNDAEFTSLPKSSREWLPLLRSALFFVQEPEELSIRTNASSLIQRFISLVGGSQDGPLVDALLNVIMPGLRRVLGSKVELVRNEVLQTLSHAIKVCEGLPVFAEMRRLLADGEEANFFVNLSHIQVHRRARALRRLRDACGHGEMRETTLSTIFLPVLEHIVAGSTDVSDHHLVNEAISTIGAISASLRWSKYNALIMRYIRLGKVRSAQQKLYIRVVSSIIDGFHFDLRPIEIAPVVQGDAADEIEEVEQADDGSEGEEPLAIQAGVLQAEESERITGSILTRLMPALSNFVAQKGDTDDSIRIPLALPTVKLASVLPGDSSSVEILRTITTISQILRSKEQDTRDIARDTICKITVFLGPVWLVRVLKEVRAALQRGPQKHVAAVVIHAMLVLAASEKDRFGLPDVAIEDAVHASSEVIWGESGKDVESEGFKTKMREVRGASSRGLDNFQLVSRLVPPSKISTILAPIREIMHASQAVKAMQHIDEALRRVALGLNANERIQPADILSLCYSLISGNSTYLKAKRKAPRQSKAADNYHVQMKRDAKEEVDFYALNAHKLVDFGLDLFVTAFRRGKFDFDDVDILARLGPLVDAVGNTLYSPTTSVLLLGLKATAAIVRCPIPQIQPALPVFVSNIMKVIKNVGGTAESEVAQTALKTLAVILRDCKTSEVSDTQLAYLLEVISPDFEEHDRQSAIFTILRAVVTRRFVVPEVFDLMDRVSSITVTSQSAHVQELCRGVLIQFLLDYPQGKGRLKGQMTFLARNLDYVFESGRVSVMELLAAVFTKFTDQLIDEYADLFFVALVTVLANDESGKCRAMAGALIQQLFGRMDERRQQNTAKVLNSWVDLRDDQAALASASLAVYALLAEDSHISEDIVQDMLNVIRPVIEESADRLALAEASLSNDQQEINHSLPLHALSAASKVIQVIPSAVRDLPLETITAHLLFPHDWVRFAAARILASILSSRSSTLSVLNDDKLLDIARKSCILLRGSQSVDGEISVVEPKLADQLVKLLWRIGRLWAVSSHILRAAYDMLTDVQTPQRPTNGLEIDDLEDSEDEEAPTGGQPLPWLMSRMSFIAKHIIISRASAHQTSASMVSSVLYTPRLS